MFRRVEVLRVTDGRAVEIVVNLERVVRIEPIDLAKQNMVVPGGAGAVIHMVDGRMCFTTVEYDHIAAELAPEVVK